jgi:hypothetical protein
VGVWTVAFGLGGFQQGRLLADPDVPFLDSVAKYLLFFRISTLADLGLVIAGFLYCWHMTGPVFRALTTGLRAAVSEKPAELPAKEGVRA